MAYDPPGAAISRRRLLQLIGSAAAAGALSACAGPGTQRTGGAPTGGGAKITGPIEGDLSFAHWRAEDQKVFDKIIADFVSKNSEVSIRQDISPSNDYQTTALQRIRSGNIGDVFTAFRGAQFVNMVKAGLYTDLGGQGVVGAYEDKFVGPGRSDGQQFGLPYQLVFNMPVYNVDLLERSGVSEVPTDWDGFLAMCETLKGKGLVPMAWPGGDPGNAGQLLNAMVMNNAPTDDMFAKIEAGQYKVTDDWFIKTLEQYVQLRPHVQPNATGTAVEPAQQIFARQRAAMLATGSFHMQAIRGLGAKFKMDLLAPITVPTDQAKYEGIHNATFILGVNTRSRKKAAGLAFVKYLSEPQVAGVYANGTAQHLTVTGVEYTNPDLKATAPWLERSTLLAPRFQFNDLDMRAAVEGAAVEVIGGRSPQEAAEKAQRVVEQRQ
jgi:raffinose/stachyose/melibiose transport system substrate-binding protein